MYDPARIVHELAAKVSRKRWSGLQRSTAVPYAKWVRFGFAVYAPDSDPTVSFKASTKGTQMSVGRIVAIVLLVALNAFLSAAQSRADYKLGPQDKLRIKVYEWRISTGQIHEWTALGGEFVVGAGGTVSLPLLGNMLATNRTPSELAADISDRLQAEIGLAKRPETAVEVMQYRPFYILGYVEKPGEYNYRPGMTVLEAMSVAGGLYRAADFQRFAREAIASKGELQELIVERVALMSREARLEAELANAEKVTFPADFAEKTGNGVAVDSMREQELLFTSRRESLRSKRESYSQVKSLLQREIKSMEAKQATIQRQLGLARQELEDVSKLVERGLAITSRRLGLEQTAAQFEAAKLDLDLAMLRAQQDISKTDRDAADLTSQRQDEILVELGMVRGKLATTAEKRITLERLIHDSEVVAPQRSSRIAELQQKPRLTIVRRAGGGEMQTIAVRDGDPVEPGDVVQVEMDIPPDVGLARR